MSRRRYSYSAPNAMRFKHIFDKAIETQQSLAVKIVGTSTAFHQKASDAFKWLIDYHDMEHPLADGKIHKKDGYALLRGKTKLREVLGDKENIHLLFNLDAQSIQFKLHNSELIKDKNWRDRVMEFVESKEWVGKKFQLDGLILSPTDVTWAEGLLNPVCSDINDVCFVSESLIVALRHSRS